MDEIVESGHSISSSNSSPTGRALVGWVFESPGRGTLSLIAGCAFTIFLCTWVVIHPRVHKARLNGRLYKITLFFKTLIAPEFIAVEGLQEWNQARRTVRDCTEVTRGGFKLVHAFYIGMLGLRYRTWEGGERVIWPNQYSWLLQQGLIKWENHNSWGLSEENIWDKSNADDTVKLAALIQVIWFVAQSIMRTAHGLPLSALESMTISYIPLFAVTYFFWWLKPKDILTPSVVELPPMSSDQLASFESMAVSSMFDSVPGQKEPLSTIWQLTPRVFEKEAKDQAFKEAERKFLSKRTEHEALQRTQGGVGREAVSGGKMSTSCDDLLMIPIPQEIVVGHWDPDLFLSKIWLAICLFGISFPALHLISWNTVFPTLVEQWLWRAAALLSIFSMLIFMHFEKVVIRWGGPLTMISLLSPIIYLVSRLAMMGGVIAAFRASDPAIYDTYVVENYWIHVL